MGDVYVNQYDKSENCNHSVFGFTLLEVLSNMPSEMFLIALNNIENTSTHRQRLRESGCPPLFALSLH